jgi:hypothetical protein
LKEEAVVNWDRATPWRQGRLLDTNAVESLDLRHPRMPGNTVVAVATHDCDLAQPPAYEPKVEVIVGCAVSKDGNHTHAKNARRLHIQYTGRDPILVEFEANAKVTVEKTRLSRFKPRSDLQLASPDLAIFQMWLASRYRRSAFPDEFELRLTKESKLADKIVKAIKPHGELIVGVFFDIDDGEEVEEPGPDDTFKLDITILHAAEPDFMAAHEAALTAARTITAAFQEKLFAAGKGWRLIELRSCEAISESSLSYLEFKRMKRWRFEHLSLAADPQQTVLAE